MSDFEEWFLSNGIPLDTDFNVAKRAFEAGQQSQQAKIDELQARVDEALKILKDWDDQSYRDDMDQLTGEIEDILKAVEK